MSYEELYEKDDRFRHYVDACGVDYDKTKEEMLRMKLVQRVGDYYMDNPPIDRVTTDNVTIGGC